MTTPWELFKQTARLEKTDTVPLAFIVDSPWLPGYAGVDTLDFYLKTDLWFNTYRRLLDRWPGVTWVPGFWVEYGMVIEPSAYGIQMFFHDDRPPSLEAVVTDPAHWANVPVPDVKEAGFMPLALRLYKYAEGRLQAEGLGIDMVVSRGPIVTACWVMGVSSFMTGLITHPKEIHQFLDNVTTMIIKWLYAQFDVLRQPEGFMLMDDLIGMLSVDHYHEFVEPYLRRIFDEFEGMVRIYHNDMRCPHLNSVLADANFEVYQFSYEADILEARAQMGHRVALMGNIPPMQVCARETPEVIYRVTQMYLDKVAPGGGLILSLGGGISTGTPAENVDALVQGWRDWSLSEADPNRETDPDILKYFNYSKAPDSPNGSRRAGRTRRANRRKRVEHR